MTDQNQILVVKDDQANKDEINILEMLGLELTRARRIRLHQAVPFSEVRVYPGDDIDAPLQEIDLIDYANQDTQGVAV